MDPKTYAEIYQKNHNMIYNIVFGKTHDHELTEEICQQVFLKCYEFRSRIIYGQEKGWLLKVANNMVIDSYRRNNTMKKIYSAEAEKILTTQKKSNDPELTVERKIFLERSMNLLREKNEDWYMAVKLAAVLEMSPCEAAKQLNIPVQLLCTRLYRGKQYLKELYEKECENN